MLPQTTYTVAHSADVDGAQRRAARAAPDTSGRNEWANRRAAPGALERSSLAPERSWFDPLAGSCTERPAAVVVEAYPSVRETLRAPGPRRCALQWLRRCRPSASRQEMARTISPRSRSYESGRGRTWPACRRQVFAGERPGK